MDVEIGAVGGDVCPLGLGEVGVEVFDEGL